MCLACSQRDETTGPKRARGLHVLLARGLIRLYRYTISAFLGRHCRYLPTCSEYTEDAIAAHGLWIGGWIGLYRILSCHPWGGSGYDPVPARLPDGLRWYEVWRLSRRAMPKPPESGT